MSIALATVLLAVLAPMAPMAGGIIIDAATVHGKVMDEKATPITGATVEVLDLNGTVSTGINATTGPDGMYSLEVPTTDEGYMLRFTFPDRIVVDLPTGVLPPLSVAQVNATLRPLPPMATLRVAVFPVQGGQQYGNYGLRMDYIYVWNATGTLPFSWSDRVSESDVVVPAPGTYHVKGTRPGYYDLTVTVTVAKGDVLDVVLDLTDLKKPTYGVVEGVVSHEGLPLPNVTVTAVPDDGSEPFWATTNDTGGYVLQLPPGNYSVQAEAEGFARSSRAARVEVGGTYAVDIALSEAQDTGALGGSPLTWALIAASVVALGAIAAWAGVRQRRARAALAAEAEAARTLECPSCGAAAPQDADRCPSCDTVFPWRSFRCPSCGAQLALDAKRCNECGNERFDLHRG